MSNEKTALISCPLCETKSHSPWGIENNYNCVRCDGCGILYVNPRPSSQHIDKAVQFGVHSAEKLDVVGTRIGSKVATYNTLITSVFKDVILNNTVFKNCKFIECELDSSMVPDKSCKVVNYNDHDDDNIHVRYY